MVVDIFSIVRVTAASLVTSVVFTVASYIFVLVVWVISEILVSGVGISLSLNLAVTFVFGVILSGLPVRA